MPCYSKFIPVNAVFQEYLAEDIGYERSVIKARGAEALAIKSLIQEDFVKADVYFQTLNVRAIKQEAKYSVGQTSTKKSEGHVTVSAVKQ